MGGGLGSSVGGGSGRVVGGVLRGGKSGAEPSLPPPQPWLAFHHHLLHPCPRHQPAPMLFQPPDQGGHQGAHAAHWVVHERAALVALGKHEGHLGRDRVGRRHAAGGRGVRGVWGGGGGCGWRGRGAGVWVVGEGCGLSGPAAPVAHASLPHKPRPASAQSTPNRASGPARDRPRLNRPAGGQRGRSACPPAGQRPAGRGQGGRQLAARQGRPSGRRRGRRRRPPAMGRLQDWEGWVGGAGRMGGAA